MNKKVKCICDAQTKSTETNVDNIDFNKVDNVPSILLNNNIFNFTAYLYH